MTDLIGAIATFAESVTAMKGLVHPLVRLHDLDEGPGCFEVKHYPRLDTQKNFHLLIGCFVLQLLESLVTALRTLEGASFPVVDIIPQPHLSFPKLENLTATYELPVVLVPPAVIEIKDDSDMRSAPKARELPTVYLRVFETEVCSRPFFACLSPPSIDTHSYRSPRSTLPHRKGSSCGLHGLT